VVKVVGEVIVGC